MVIHYNGEKMYVSCCLNEALATDNLFNILTELNVIYF